VSPFHMQNLTRLKERFLTTETQRTRSSFHVWRQDFCPIVSFTHDFLSETFAFLCVLRASVVFSVDPVFLYHRVSFLFRDKIPAQLWVSGVVSSVKPWFISVFSVPLWFSVRGRIPCSRQACHTALGPEL
jgi:hypothetical protein